VLFFEKIALDAGHYGESNLYYNHCKSEEKRSMCVRMDLQLVIMMNTTEETLWNFAAESLQKFAQSVIDLQLVFSVCIAEVSIHVLMVKDCNVREYCEKVIFSNCLLEL
jgi:hypothetical protein